jgi:signal transduction histidine kinase
VNRATPGNAPARLRGPFARWPRTADAVLALAVLVDLVFVKDAAGDDLAVRSIGDVGIIPLLGIVASAVALYWRRRFPLATLAVSLVAWPMGLVGADKNLSGIVTIIALYSMGRYATWDRRSRLGAAAGVATAMALIVVDHLVDSPPWPEDPSYGDAAFGCVVMLAAWFIGRIFQMRADHATERRRAQVAEGRQILVEERARIARELHDVVAHRVSLMTVQAGAAKAVAAEDPEGALQAMGAVEEAGRQALTELRHLLGVLRPETDLDGLGPQPGLADLTRLVEQIRAAGVNVALTKDKVPAELPARVDLFAYRIIQEALTNVLKHAGPGARTDVRLCTSNGGVVIEVVNDSPNGAPGSPGFQGGHGLIGMRERALLLGGTLDAGPRPGGGFRVVAHLPTQGEAP